MYLQWMWRLLGGVIICWPGTSACSSCSCMETEILHYNILHYYHGSPRNAMTIQWMFIRKWFNVNHLNLVSACICTPRILKKSFCRKWMTMFLTNITIDSVDRITLMRPIPASQFELALTLFCKFFANPLTQYRKMHLCSLSSFCAGCYSLSMFFPWASRLLYSYLDWRDLFIFY